MKKDKQCPKGQVWCSVKKKCMPEGDDKGKGEGSIGQPGCRVKEAIDLVDVILVGDYFTYSVVGEVDSLLDEIQNKIDNIPDQDIDQLQQDVKTDLSTDSNDREKEETEEYIENTVEENMKNSVQLLVTEETYREFFKSMLKKWNIKSPSELEASKKKEFFNAVDKGWKAKKETD